MKQLFISNLTLGVTSLPSGGNAQRVKTHFRQILKTFDINMQTKKIINTIEHSPEQYQRMSPACNQGE